MSRKVDSIPGTPGIAAGWPGLDQRENPVWW